MKLETNQYKLRDQSKKYDWTFEIGQINHPYEIVLHGVKSCKIEYWAKSSKNLSPVGAKSSPISSEIKNRLIGPQTSLHDHLYSSFQSLTFGWSILRSRIEDTQGQNISCCHFHHYVISSMIIIFKRQKKKSSPRKLYLYTVLYRKIKHAQTINYHEK